jgi:hypothetical protein
VTPEAGGRARGGGNMCRCVVENGAGSVGEATGAAFREG